MEKIDLVFEHSKLPDKANLVINRCKELADEICSRPEDQGHIAQFEPSDGHISWHLLNSVVRHTQPDRPAVFCEWGSGLGLVTLLASLAGMTATGIEIEEELFDQAQDLSQEFSIPATFINASIYPKDNQVSPINYKDVNLYFAYPWPNQIVRMIELFEQVAASGAILVCYHGGRNYRVLKR